MSSKRFGSLRRRAKVHVPSLLLVAFASPMVHADPGKLLPYAPPPPPIAAAPSPPLQPSEMLAAAPSLRRARKWYGYQLMAADLTSLGLAIFGSQGAVASIGLLAAPPVIHGMHGRTALAITSPFLRLGLTVAGALAGASLASCTHASDGFCGGGAVVGGGLGLLAAMALDWSLAFQTIPSPSPPDGQRSHPTRFQLTAAGVAPMSNGASLALGGRF